MPFADMPLTQTPLRSVSCSEQPDSKDQPSETTRFPHLGCRYRHLYHLTASIRFSLMDVPPRTLLNSSPPSLCAPVEEKPRLSPKPWEEEPRDTIANKVPPATLSTQRLFPEQCKRVFISHQDLTLVDRNSYFNSHLETFPTFSISSASYPPTSSTSLSALPCANPACTLAHPKEVSAKQSCCEVSRGVQ
ncbi:hypothetical protein Q9233_002728 [Columba guinea]|nr:hypothetical protein Q9233_002728 [Columba guinea]